MIACAALWEFGKTGYDRRYGYIGVAYEQKGLPDTEFCDAITLFVGRIVELRAARSSRNLVRLAYRSVGRLLCDGSGRSDQSHLEYVHALLAEENLHLDGVVWGQYCSDFGCFHDRVSDDRATFSAAGWSKCFSRFRCDVLLADGYSAAFRGDDVLR